MFSRFLTSHVINSGRSGLLNVTAKENGKLLKAAAGSTASAAKSGDGASGESGERDLVNFPRWGLLKERPPVRLGIFPETWFTAFHEKTGVSGPYIFMFTFGTYLVSKELYVLEHDFPVLVGLTTIGTYVAVNFGDKIKAAMQKGVDDENFNLDYARQNEIDMCTSKIAEEENSQWMASSYQGIVEAQRESAALQLELAYRDRLQSAHNQVKQRLDYQVEMANVIRGIEQRHMNEWIIGQVRQSLTAKHEDDAMKQCLADLKALAAAK